MFVLSNDDAIAKLCAHVNFLEQNIGNSAKYVAGVDVYGNPVVPADLPDGGIKSRMLNDPIMLPIDINLAERYGLNLPDGVEINPNIANMVLYQDGRVFFGNEDISDSIKSFCQSRDKEMKKNQSNQQEQHGHESANPVLSSDKIEGQYPEDNDRRYND